MCHLWPRIACHFGLISTPSCLSFNKTYIWIGAFFVYLILQRRAYITWHILFALMLPYDVTILDSPIFSCLLIPPPLMLTPVLKSVQIKGRQNRNWLSRWRHLQPSKRFWFTMLLLLLLRTYAMKQFWKSKTAIANYWLYLVVRI